MTQTSSLRIALCAGHLGGGGIGLVMLHLAGALARAGHAVDLLHFAQDPAAMAGRAVPPGCRAIEIGARTRAALPAVVGYLRRDRPDLVISARDYIHALILTARGLSGLGREGPALIWSFHTHRASEMAHQARAADARADRLMRLLAGRADALVAVSDGVAEGLARDLRLPRAAVQTIANPVWTEARRAARLAPCAHPWLADRPALAPMRGAAPGPAVLLAIGRLAVQKDFATLIRALQAVRTAPPPRLIVLGEGPERAALQAQIDAAGLAARVDLAGHVADVLPYLSRADLFVLSSRWEGFSLALAEAMGCGCPVVSTDCPEGPRALLQGGRLGRLVAVGDAPALAGAIDAALAAHPAPAPEAALARALALDDTSAAAAYLELGRAALARWRRA